ncbi:MAG: hypothetical protein ACOY4R_25390 [Pseudomonadota bacterium]
MTENFYARCMNTEHDLCVPIATPAVMNNIPKLVAATVNDEERPIATIDLEHLQVCDYTRFERTSELQRATIQRLRQESPIRTDEMAFLAFRSMVTFVWPEPKSNDDVIRVANFEHGVNHILTAAALDVAASLQQPEALLPYWGRLAFLRVMAELPEEQVAQYGLEKVACTLLKRPAFNATTYALDAGEAVIALNFALEPLLKNLNKHLLHFRHTEHLAGPMRMPRAWSALLPTVRYLWANGPANALLKDCLFFDQDVLITAHNLTASQVDFILMHELGHVLLDHPRRYKALKDAGGDVSAIRHEFEYNADTFALGLVRSRALNGVRYILSVNRTKGTVITEDEAIAPLGKYLREYEAICLLFAYMRFIDEAGQFLKARLGGNLGFRERLDTHPRACDRLNRLGTMLLGDVPYSTDLLRYADDFFAKLMAYLEELPDRQLMAPMDTRDEQA